VIPPGLGLQLLSRSSLEGDFQIAVAIDQRCDLSDGQAEALLGLMEELADS
jgi:hypothetical protein